MPQSSNPGTYIPGPYHIFRIFDPKERTIACAPFRDRVVHHAIVDVLTPFYENIFIYDSYASRPNKGTKFKKCLSKDDLI
jgi:hypothetical protein